MMAFTSLGFWALFAATFLAIEWAKKAADEARFLVWRKWLYLLFSLAFYGLASGKLLLVMLASIGTNHALARWMHRSRSRLAVVLAVTFNLVLLGTFKYAYFVAGLFPEAMPAQGFQWGEFRLEQWMLPLGISFYTFQSISHALDVHRGRLPQPTSLLSFATYITFFPQLVAGPIVRAADFLPQLERRVSDSLSSQKHHLGLIVQGFMKKMVFGDWVGTLLVDPVFGAPGDHSGVDLALALYGYSLQVYADFSGYTDMAQGMAGMLGMRLPKNFDFPYKATSPADFWRRWHMSLSQWWKDYVYIPLGGNRAFSWVSIAFLGALMGLWGMRWDETGGWLVVAGSALLLAAGSLMSPSFRTKLATSSNVLLVMLLGGLWHGSHLNFVTWGAINGLAIVAWIWLRRPSSAAWRLFLGWFCTFHIVVLSRIWFRAGSLTAWSELSEGPHPSDAWENAQLMATQLVSPQVWQTMPWSASVWMGTGLLLVGYGIHWMPSTWQERLGQVSRQVPLWTLWLAWACLVACAVMTEQGQGKPFIYWQF